MDVLLFSKHCKTVGDLDLPEAVERVAEWGFDGLDLTVRDGGYVDPAAVETALPEAVDLCREQDLSVSMITTGITDDDEQAKKIFETADEMGIEVLKLGYWGYDGLGSLDANVSAMVSDLEEIDALSADYEVTPSVHVHASGMVSASGVLLAEVLEDLDNVAAYPDLGHLSVEGGQAGWRIALERLAPHAAVIGCKDFGWTRDADSYRADGTEWGRYPTTLGDGLVDWPAALSFLSSSGFEGPLSLHVEYADSLAELAEGASSDRATLEAALAEAGVEGDR